MNVTMVSKFQTKDQMHFHPLELSDEDISDIKFSIEQEIDAVFVSYVHGAECVRRVRQLIAEHSKPEHRVVVISKIEDELVRTRFIIIS